MTVAAGGTSAAVTLNGLVLLPLATAAFVVLLRGSSAMALRAAVLGAVATFGWSAWAVVSTGTTVRDSPVDVAWIASLGVRWHLGLDGISGPFVLLTTLVIALCLGSLLRRSGWPAERDTASLAALLLVVETGALGCFLALDMVLFFVFFEVALIPMWFVISRWGDPDDEPGRRAAANRFLVFTVLGSAFMLVGFLLVHSLTGTFDITAIAASYSPTGRTSVAASVLVVLGLAVKTPLWPLHIWLPDAHAKAPTVGSVVLAALLLKLGAYGLIRFWMPVTDPSWDLVVPLVAALAVVGIVYAALACLAQDDLKRLIAYSSVGHMGFVVLGVSTFTVGGVQAAVYVGVAHGLITGLLFFLAGAIKDRFHTTALARLKALYGRAPLLGGVFAFAAMASLGLPGLAGFWGEMLAIRSALQQDPALPGATFAVLAVIAAFGVILTSAYLLALVRRIMQGVPDSGQHHPAAGPVAPVGAVGTVGSSDPATGATVSLGVRSPDATSLDWWVWSPLVVLTLGLGVAPGLLLPPVAVAARSFLGGL